ncbi:PilZ domain-containing protein [uncultured Sphingomonas sp.]|uniref:PilZ domain-containing protein n=1 Tax=uncultured Sphingomonas sp. TaxID=158754 RepID=UPI0026201BEA|nr:PilZ domain-containing protein [uncultured Sphingomonas sp.]
MQTHTDHISARERRGDERHIVRLDATVRAYRMPTLAAALVDLSAGGAMLEADARAFGNGDEIVLTTGPVEIVATIAWLNDRFFGLAFHRRLDAYELGLLRKSGHA